jgi:hypothetical protein
MPSTKGAPDTRSTAENVQAGKDKLVGLASEVAQKVGSISGKPLDKDQRFDFSYENANGSQITARKPPC